jgi:outer membrane protein TolC
LYLKTRIFPDSRDFARMKRLVLLLILMLPGMQVLPAEEANSDGDDAEAVVEVGGGPSNGEQAAGIEAVEIGVCLSLEDCIELAAENSRQFLREEENFVLERLSYGLVKHDYNPLLSGTLSTDVDDAGAANNVAQASITKRLVIGGDISLSASSTGLKGGDEEVDSYGTVVSLEYVQPLLKDAGRLVGGEDLRLAERELTYAERELVLFRQQFLIGIVRQYYRILQLEKAVNNQERKVENARTLLERSQAQRDRGKVSPIDVYRAELSLLQAENQLIEARDGYYLNVDEFKIDLGMPTDEEIALERRDLQYAPLDPRVETITEKALANRLDLKTATEQVDDSKRGLEIARNRLRSRLDFGVSVQSTAGPVERFSDQDFGEAEWTVGLEYEIPFDRVLERTDYRRELIAYLRQVRNREELRDVIIVEVRSVVRDLRKAQATLVIQERNIEVARKQLERAREDFDRGAISNRDVVDALNDLTDAENAYDEAVVDYLIARLELLRVTGELDFERWRELVE